MKYARGGPWCARHSDGNQAVVRRASTTTPRASLPAAPTRNAFYKTFIISQESFLPVKLLLVSEVVPKLEADFLKRGVRKLFDFTDAERRVLDPLLLSIVSAAKMEIKFPLKSWKIETPYIVIAAPDSAFSNGWTKGKIHRDFTDGNQNTTGVYTFMLFVDPVTSTNGSIQFWPRSQLLGVDEKAPQRGIKKHRLSSEKVVGPPATVVVWDSRILHRSLPNSTKNQRMSLLWTVTSKHRPEILDLSSA